MLRRWVEAAKQEFRRTSQPEAAPKAHCKKFRHDIASLCLIEVKLKRDKSASTSSPGALWAGVRCCYPACDSGATPGCSDADEESESFRNESSPEDGVPVYMPQLL